MPFLFDRTKQICSKKSVVSKKLLFPPKTPQANLFSQPDHLIIA
jgi:hypothetical protein